MPDSIAVGRTCQDRLLGSLLRQVTGYLTSLGEAQNDVHIGVFLKGHRTRCVGQHINVHSILARFFQVLTVVDVGLLEVKDGLGFSDTLG